MVLNEICRRVRSSSWFKQIHMSDVMKLTNLCFGKCEQKYTRRASNISKETSSDLYSFNREHGTNVE